MASSFVFSDLLASASKVGYALLTDLLSLSTRPTALCGLTTFAGGGLPVSYTHLTLPTT